MYIPLVKKWNVPDFDHVIGQPMVVKILKNSLFLDHIFPVYIFAGKHGCGKTSTARLFSTALNCVAVQNFRKNIHEKIPCYACESCKAMKSAQHPDFIEIDAASHTGVDNVRLIIESALLLPVFGNKKIYLIDEAHMLSKAAWNAFLKILEEPPKNVVFILATTAEEKILETVRSRCFQLFFKAIKEEELTDYLIKIAIEEKIEHTKEGIRALVRASGGSVRDALNLLDQARLAAPVVDVVSLSSMIFYTADQEIIQILHGIFTKNTSLMLKNMRIIFTDNHIRAEKIVDQLAEYAHAILLFLYGQSNVSFSIPAVILQEFSYVKPSMIINFLDQLYTKEMTMQHVEKAEILLEIILLRFIESENTEKFHVVEINKFILPKTASFAEAPVLPKTSVFVETTPDGLANKQPEKEEIILENKDTSLLKQFIVALEEKRDPLLLSVFKQASLKNVDVEKKILTLSFKKEVSFFESLLRDNKADWQPILEKIWGVGTTLNLEFSLFGNVVDVKQSVLLKTTPDRLEKKQSEKLEITEKKIEQSSFRLRQGYDGQVAKASAVVKTMADKSADKPMGLKNNNFSNNFNNNVQRFQKLKPVDIKDATKWPHAHTLQSIFPGTVTEVE